MISIIIEPTTDSLVAAYRPIRFYVSANQMPASGNASPIVIADIYFDGIYHSSISATAYEPVTIFIFTFFFYSFDIQDKVQEYLNSNFSRLYGTSGDIENGQDEKFSCKVKVEFREGYIDANGFTQTYGTAPVQGTRYTAPVAGTGTVVSNEFYALNAAITHEDDPDFEQHLTHYRDMLQATYQLSHRPNYISNTNKVIAGGSYFIGKNDNDFLFCFSPSTPPWFVSAIITYRDGTTVTTSAANYPSTSITAANNKVYCFNAGIPQLKKMFAGINWDLVVEYEVFVYNVFFQALRQKYTVNNFCDYDRIFFLNNLGTYDAINFFNKQEVNKTVSNSWQAFGIWPAKEKHASNRMQVSQSDLIEVQNHLYGEKDMPWIKELLATPRAYLQWNPSQGQNPTLLPIKIEDSEVVTIKNVDSYEYIVKIKYRFSNERINLR